MRRTTTSGKVDELPNPEDSLASLPPVPRNLLQAARRLLDRGGLEALRLQAIAAEAGEAKGSIAYYFGNKAGLIAALVDHLAHDANLSVIRTIETLPIGEARLHALVDGETRISSEVQDFRAFFEILPHVLRDDDLRPRVARLYDGYRDTMLRCLGAADDQTRGRLLPHAMLMIALVDGLAIQHALDPQKVDISLATRLWEQLLRAALEDVGNAGPGDAAAAVERETGAAGASERGA